MTFGYRPDQPILQARHISLVLPCAACLFPGLHATRLAACSTQGLLQVSASWAGWHLEVLEGLHERLSHQTGADCRMQGLSLRVPAGTSCAVVGTSGSGKSTILRLLFRFYEPDSGQLTINGRDINDFTLRRWDMRPLLAYVPLLPRDVASA